MPDLADALLSAASEQRPELLRQASAEELQAAIVALGHLRSEAAAQVLGLIDSVVGDRAVRKAARRELHRLRSAGVHLPEIPAAAIVEAAPQRAEERVQVTEAWATDIDPTGSRALWLLGERPLGGAWFAALLLNDLQGLAELSLVDTTRKRFLRELDQRRREEGIWVSLPGDYAWRLVREAVDVSRARGAALPNRYRPLRDVFGEAPGPPEHALVYQTISPVEATFHPDWLAETQALMGEPEVRGWYVPMPETLRKRALEVALSTSVTLVVPGHEPSQQALQLLDEASRQTLTASVRRALQRRLEETAYIFVTSDRLAAAQRAVAAARGLEDQSRPLEQQPFLRILLESGLARSVRTEAVAGRSAADVLVELMERSVEQARESGRGQVESRPSGLILPR
jgi:hypothetical protein